MTRSDSEDLATRRWSPADDYAYQWDAAVMADGEDDTINNDREGRLLLHQDPTGACAGGVGATVWDAGLVAAKYFERWLTWPVSCRKHDLKTSSVTAVALERLLASEGKEVGKTVDATAEATLPRQLNILELGSGTGLVGLILAKLLERRRISAHLYLTDRTCALPLLNANVARYACAQVEEEPINSETSKTELGKTAEPVMVTTHALDWTNVDEREALAKHDFDLVLVADCVYRPELFEPLVDTLLKVTTVSVNDAMNQNLNVTASASSDNNSTTTTAAASEATTTAASEAPTSPDHRDYNILLAYERRDFPAEVEFFRTLGQHFWFRAVTAEEQHADWQSPDDIYLFWAARKSVVV